MMHSLPMPVCPQTPSHACGAPPTWYGGGLLRVLAVVFLAMLLAACSTTRKSDGASSSGQGTYTVVAGDTLHRIARLHGQSVDSLMRLNNIRNANQIRVGQVLRVQGTAAATTPPRGGAATAGKPAAQRQAPAPAIALPKQRIGLAWPAQGTVDRNLPRPSPYGLFILNSAGTPVQAVADGKVIYADNGLRGYGNLIIVRHASDYLSIYAHNRSMAVSEGQSVKQGQKIAEMGSTESRQVGLYFELRHNGKATDASRLLPPR